MGRPASLLALLSLVGAALLATAAPAAAACHVAAFVEPQVEGDESVGVVSLIVELQGRVATCAGTVDVRTVDGTAVAGEDYEAVTATLTFVEGDDRVETVDIVLVDDGVAEGPEQLTVELVNATGSISGTGSPATVTIVDGGASSADPGQQAADDEVTGGEAAAEGEEVVVGDPVLIIAVIALAVFGLAAFVGLRRRGG